MKLRSIETEKISPDNKINVKTVALAGNPNVGKSTLFNLLTGMNQHTGNWAGKTVATAMGKFSHKENDYLLVDLPGTYSLMASSREEEVARDYICFQKPDAVVVVVDGTCLERNLNLVLQTMEISKRVMVCVNLLDEAEKKGITVNIKALEKRLAVPVVGISAGKKQGIRGFCERLNSLTNGKEPPQSYFRITYKKELENILCDIENKLAETLPCKLNINRRFLAQKLLSGEEKELLKYSENLLEKEVEELKNKAALALNNSKITKEAFKDYTAAGFVLTAENICDRNVLSYKNKNYNQRDQKIDRILTGKITGPAIMLLFLGVIFWITIYGANYPSQLLTSFFEFTEVKLLELSNAIGLPEIISNILFCGVYRVLYSVVAVMLPPMAIFFPIFTLLEDLGYLPRIAFNLDRGFKVCSASGKQALTMCMGFGCNAAGVTGCRIIDSKRERLLAILTNNFVPCNGRFPTLIAMISMFFVVGGGFADSIISALILTLVILVGIGMTFLASKLLSVTLLKGESSSFALELPPFRKPKIGSVILRSVLDRTVFVLLRAILVAAPAGLVIWLLANITSGGELLLRIISDFLDPVGRLMGMDGVILFAFILGFPANEIVIPIIIMAYMASGTLGDIGGVSELRTLFINNGWTETTAICVMLFSLMHWPCSTTLLTVKSETGSLKWTAVAFLLPTIIGFLVCVLINLLMGLL